MAMIRIAIEEKADVIGSRQVQRNFIEVVAIIDRKRTIKGEIDCISINFDSRQGF